MTYILLCFCFSSLVVLSVQMEDYKDALKFLGHLEIANLKRFHNLVFISNDHALQTFLFFYLLIFYLNLTQKNVFVAVFCLVSVC